MSDPNFLRGTQWRKEVPGEEHEHSNPKPTDGPPPETERLSGGGLTFSDLAAIGYEIPRDLALDLIRLEGKTRAAWVKEMVHCLAERWAELYGGPLPHHSRMYQDAIHAHLRGELK